MNGSATAKAGHSNPVSTTLKSLVDMVVSLSDGLERRIGT